MSEAVLTAEEAAAQLAERIKRHRDDLLHYAPRALNIRQKSGAITPLALNSAQMWIHHRLEQQLAATGKVRAIVLKGRQQGASTYIQARFFHRVSLRPGLLALILTHLGDSTDALFGMTKRYYDLCPDELKPKASAANENELSFAELDSGYVVATAGNRKGVGRGRTFQLFHGSEMAFWPDPESIMSGLGQTVPDEIGSEIILESTANGVGNAFHQAWLDAEKGKSDYIAIFVPWYWQPEYRRPVYPGFALEPDEQVYYETYRPRGITLEHMVWRRAKLANELRGDVALFDQEYPAEPLLAFTKVAGTPLIPADLVAAAMRPDLNVEASGPLIMGVDPAEYGDDDSAVVLRRGRRAFGTDTGGKVQRWSKLSPMELVGRIARLADHYKPAAINVDATGLGSGVADRLRELNYPVNRIMFGGKPSREQLYVLKRDEIWGDMLEWLQDAPNQLPNDDVLAGELCAPQYTYDSSRRLKVESKESMRKRGVPSPDSADALALTFATPFADYGPGAANGKDDGWRAVRSRRPVH